MPNDAAIKPADERDYLVEVGRRVRHCRHAISMTRRQLAEQSGLSERYLAQLEAGDGNISILLIRRVARVLRVDLPRLIAEPVEQLSSRPTRIALMAIGDSAARGLLGRVALMLSSTLGAPLVDIGSELLAELGVPAEEAASHLGAEACRYAQRRALVRLTAAHRRCVIAMGELPVPDVDLLRLVHERCVTVWLREGGTNEADYVQADHWVDVDGRTAEQVLANVHAHVERNFASEPHYRSRSTDRPGQWTPTAA